MFRKIIGSSRPALYLPEAWLPFRAGRAAVDRCAPRAINGRPSAESPPKIGVTGGS